MLLETGFTAGAGSSVWSILKLLLMLVLVLALAYATAKLIAKYQGNMLSGRSDIRIVQSFKLIGDKYIAIAKIGEGYYALGIGKDNITLIDKLDPEQLSIKEVGGNEPKASFKDVLAGFSKKKSDTHDGEE